MGLPEQSIQWPPSECAEIMAAYREYGAWYSGNTSDLAAVYGGTVTFTKPPPWYRFWSRPTTHTQHQTRTQLHIPLAGDIATTSAALLFGEAASLTIPEAHVENAPEAATRTETRLQEILDEGDVEQRLTEAAEIAAAFGGVYLKPAWDTDVASVPLLSVVQPDMALPEFRLDRLIAVTLWNVLEVDGHTWWRHVERHEVNAQNGNGVIQHGLYMGSEDNLGVQVELTGRPETEDLQDVQPLPFKGIGIRYIPNRKPNQRFRGSSLGQSDYAGAEGMMDALDEVWTSWMRDVRLGKARLLVPESYLERQSADAGFAFDMDQEVFTPLEIEPGGDRGITDSQFAIRVDEHERSAMALIEQIVGHAGYAPQTFGLHIEGQAESGTALRIRERKTLSTQQRKRRSWESPLSDLLEQMLAIDREIFRSGITPYRPQATLADSLTPDENETAVTVELLNRAGAISAEVKVKMVHPDWDEKQVQGEVQRLREDSGLALPDVMQIGQA